MKKATEQSPSTASAGQDFQSGHRSRLRDRFLERGSDSLADYELLEMALFAAKPRGDVKPLARMLIKEFGSFAGVIRATPQALRAMDGVGDAVIASLKVIEASCVRILSNDLHTDRPIINSWSALLDYCQLTMSHQPREEFRVFFLTSKNTLIKDEVQHTGTIDHTPVYPREIVKRALELGAVSLILAHNHPSGDPSPSKTDIDLTKMLADAACPFNIRIHDHVIIGKNKHYSFKQCGLL
ncbi:MAG: JAB domain-containing protein [Alphaproteobacteria bacterium]|nr:MAG: JAB domain-containing protein [Alphaproteobacteria bacterium]